MKTKILSLLIAGLTITTLADAQKSGPRHMPPARNHMNQDRRHDKIDINRDRKDIHKDNKDISKDRQDIKLTEQI